MSSKWLKLDSKQRKIPKGLRLRLQADGRRQWYIRAREVVGGPQKDIPTGKFEGEPGARRWVIDEHARICLDRRKVVSKAVAAQEDELISVERLLYAIHQRYIAKETRDEKLKYRHLARIRNLIEYFKPNTDVRTLTPQHLEAYITFRRAQVQRRNKGPRYVTIFRELDLLAESLRWGRVNRIVPENFALPFPKAGDYDHEAPDEAQEAHVRSWEQVQAFFAELDDATRDLFNFSLRTGWRDGEIKRLRVGRLKVRKDGTGTLEVRRGEQKNKRLPTMLLELSPIAVQCCQRSIARRGVGDLPEAPIFPRPETLRRTIERANRIIGANPSVKLRDMRATYGRHVYDSYGQDIEAARRFLRHETIEMTRRYLRLSREKIRAFDADAGIPQLN